MGELGEESDDTFDTKIAIPYKTVYSAPTSPGISAFSTFDAQRDRSDSTDIGVSPLRLRPKKPPPRPPPDQKPFQTSHAHSSPNLVLTAPPGTKSDPTSSPRILTTPQALYSTIPLTPSTPKNDTAPPLTSEKNKTTPQDQFQGNDWLKKEKEMIDSFYNENHFWTSLETMHKSAEAFSQEVQSQMDFFASRSKPEDDGTMVAAKVGYQTYGRFLSSYVVSEYAHQQDFHGLANTLGQLDEDRNKLLIRLHRRDTAFTGLVHNLEAAKSDKKRYKERKADYA